MIIRSNKVQEGLIQKDTKGDQFIFTHAQCVDPAMERAESLRQSTNRGWNQTKTMKLVASIPVIEFLRHPEWNSDPNALKRWLSSDYGRLFKVSES